MFAGVSSDWTCGEEMRSKVTTIIPCYNGEKYIHETIESALKQSYNSQIIAVDDGSTDGTLQILNSFSPLVEVLRHADCENHGKAAALNLGITRSNGEYIAFLDQDDTWASEKVLKSLELMDVQKEIGLVYTNGLWMDFAGSTYETIMRKGHKEENSPISLLMNCYIKSASSVMVRRSVFESVGLFDEKLTGCDDHDMWLRIVERFKIGYIDEPLYNYRIHGNQLSSDIEMWLCGFAILDKACRRNGYNYNVKRKRLAVLYYRVAQHNLKKGCYLRGFGKLLASGVLDPARAWSELSNLRTYLKQEISP